MGRQPQHACYLSKEFYCRAIEETIAKGVIAALFGIPVHSKTARFLQYPLSDKLFLKEGVVPQFYFVVDRLDLADQAFLSEFNKRGLKCCLISTTSRTQSKQDGYDVMLWSISRNLRMIQTWLTVWLWPQSSKCLFGRWSSPFNERGSICQILFYQVDARVHIKIASRIGTPLITHKKDGKTKESHATTREHIFGDYIHKYHYYTQSIDDLLLPLCLMREDIETMAKIILDYQRRNSTAIHPRKSTSLLIRITCGIYSAGLYHQRTYRARDLVFDDQTTAG